MGGFVGPAGIAKKGEEPVREELKMLPIEYSEPYCHGQKMGGIFTYRNARKGVYMQFKCSVCGHVESRLIAVPPIGKGK